MWEWEETQKPKIWIVIYNYLSLFYPKSNMILWSIRTFWYKGSAENKEQINVRGKNKSSKISSLTLKAWVSPPKENETIDFTFYKWVYNVIPVTNPTQYTKLGKHIVKNTKKNN